MKITEFRNLIREEVRKVLKEESNLEYYIVTGYPKETLRALSKHIDVKKIKPRFASGFRAGGKDYGKKMYILDFTADKSLVQVLGKYPDLKAPYDKLLQHYNVEKPKASKIFSNNEASDIEDYFSNYDVELTSNFNLKKFAKENQLKSEEAKTALLNLEDTKVMKDIAKGNYSTFDIYDPSIFNDEYGQMMDDLGFEEA